MNTRQFLAAIALTAWALSAAALPSVEEVQAEVGRGNFAHAETLMQEVVAAKPGSARAHYIYGEILAHNKRFDEAAQQIARAKAIDSTLGFTDASKFRALEQLLEREQQRQAKPVTAPSTSAAPVLRQHAPEQSSGLSSWIWILGLAGLGAVAWTMFSRRRQVTGAPMGMPGMAPGSAVATAPAGYGPGYGSAPGASSGMLGVGLAAAGGVAAGMLASRLLDGHHDSASNSAATPAAGGLIPGMFDDAPVGSTAQELEHRDVDFGVGDGWGAEAGSDAGGDSWQ
jgi:Tetratricopeptide repeat